MEGNFFLEFWDVEAIIIINLGFRTFYMVESKQWISNYLMNSLQQFICREQFNLVMLFSIKNIYQIRELGNLELYMDDGWFVELTGEQKIFGIFVK